MRHARGVRQRRRDVGQLLEEAVPGLAAALGAEHPDTRYFQGLQTRVRASLREAAAGGESEREKRAKRRRRGRA